MKLSLGPIQYFWSHKDVLEFYARMIETPVNTLYLGEVVCGKRRELSPIQWIDLARQLASSCGKEIILSTMTLIESGADLKGVKRLCDNEGLLVEANDIAAIHYLSEKKLPFVAGPAINIYNAQSLQFLMSQGLKRWVVPVELGQQQLRAALTPLKVKPEIEVLAWGRLPLAYSARCFTARHHGVKKDDCAFVCQQYPAGLQLKSQESQSLFTLNGIATLSGMPVNLLNHHASLTDTGVSHARISPEWEQTEIVIETFYNALRGSSTASLAGGTDGYWRGQPGIDLIARE
ncbi:U32 family peptidase [Simiduia agarivorans]|uniref:Ubiquinone biosynthesis protein UbiV n=1 Tax=Simiduia agarivorans (strain DSM 21679 / JCM 13881 / BCRC 17597 / SA1) TaxID=1117647 RepID=K4KPK2_SIMAS|nr:U32 family peptidase [Simiduia agarivorans]AFV00146.1 protease [Simiduia agarivorans SA1 = DSM 21679]